LALLDSINDHQLVNNKKINTNFALMLNLLPVIAENMCNMSYFLLETNAELGATG
jgi:hypothetical protein